MDMGISEGRNCKRGDIWTIFVYNSRDHSQLKIKIRMGDTASVLSPPQLLFSFIIYEVRVQIEVSLFTVIASSKMYSMCWPQTTLIVLEENLVISTTSQWMCILEVKLYKRISSECTKFT